MQGPILTLAGFNPLQDKLSDFFGVEPHLRLEPLSQAPTKEWAKDSSSERQVGSPIRSAKFLFDPGKNYEDKAW